MPTGAAATLPKTLSSNATAPPRPRAEQRNRRRSIIALVPHAVFSILDQPVPRKTVSASVADGDGQAFPNLISDHLPRTQHCEGRVPLLVTIHYW